MKTNKEFTGIRMDLLLFIALISMFVVVACYNPQDYNAKKDEIQTEEENDDAND